MGDDEAKKSKKSKKVLRFVVSTALLAAGPGMAACGADGSGEPAPETPGRYVNEPAPEQEFGEVEEPEEVEAPEPAQRRVPVNEPAPSPERGPDPDPGLELDD